MTVVLIRHAERHSSGSDALSPAGKQRAIVLKRMFAQSGVTAVFTSEFNRTKQTAAPLATTLGLSPQEIAPDTQEAVDQIRAAGELVVVVGHSDTVPMLVGALGGPTDIEIDENEFDRMFVVSVASSEVSAIGFRYLSA